MGNLSASEMAWSVPKRSSNSSTPRTSVSKGPLYQACSQETADPPSMETLENFKKRTNDLNLPFATLLDHALEAQPLETVKTNFELAYAVSALALHGHEFTEKEFIFDGLDFQGDCFYSKNMPYPKFPFSPLRSLKDLNISYEDVYWRMEVVLSKEECENLEENTVAQRRNLEWRAAHSYRISASQVGAILNRVRKPTEAFLKNIFSSFVEKPQGFTPRPIQHGIENEENALSEYKKQLTSLGFEVELLPVGFVTGPSFFGWAQRPTRRLFLKMVKKLLLE
ncbi:unnamed protein product [Didymodactylos carnosus]|uniref:Uncharacterized protein n=1 Tax=Didymodactylos carnosus TaxID=1234261 RepID=A0A815XPA4_9BILA|nr:unnamed protein product [Didymodactylos carnosus]CAF4421977.1 unnamed protein product [Didymodactylos carnosus]